MGARVGRTDTRIARHAGVLALIALALTVLTVLAPTLARSDATSSHHRHRHSATIVALARADQTGTVARADHAAVAVQVPASDGLQHTIASSPRNALGRTATVVDAPTPRGPPSGQ